MDIRPGEYDDIVADVMERMRAVGAILLVFSGNRGSGFSVHVPIAFAEGLPEMLWNMADQVEKDIEKRVDYLKGRLIYSLPVDNEVSKGPLTADQVRKLADLLRGSKQNLYLVCKREFGTEAVDMEDGE
ncbi:MAG: hypothetical protein KGL39_00440 [Patescibacteria group bacterium]|nr:hypothetical protein [Patescibacteria group bacterium]